MRIRTISTGQLRRMGDQEGLVLQGCGGDLQEWVDGINEILAQEGILKKGAGFEEAYTFRHDGLTCMLFPIKENMELDVGKLAVWRLASYSTFGGTWLSDYVPNRLGVFIQERENVPKRINLFFALTNSAKLELQETVLQAYQQQIDPNYTPKRSYEEQGILQEVQHQREYYPQPPYPEPQYPDWVNDCDDGMLPMEMGGM